MFLVNGTLAQHEVHSKRVSLYRRKFLQAHLKSYGDGNLRIASTASPIILGTHESMTSNDPETRAKIDKAYANGLQKTNPCTKSLFVPEFTASPHPRFLGLAQSIRERREEKVKILSPIYKDVNTSYQVTEDEPYPGQIYMDAMHFGMGNSCLQITYETQNIDHARYLYDMFTPFTAIVSALSQCSPIFKGKLSAHDFRW